MQATATPEHDAGAAGSAFVVSYAYTFDHALEAGRFFQARLYRWYVVTLGLGLLAGAILMLNGQEFGLTIVPPRIGRFGSSIRAALPRDIRER